LRGSREGHRCSGWPPKLISILLSGKEGDADFNEPAQKKVKKAGAAVAMQVIAGES
jgi:hypothetical protein